MYDCGIILDNEFNKMFPHRENYKVNKGIKLQKDGNFIMLYALLQVDILYH